MGHNKPVCVRGLITSKKYMALATSIKRHSRAEKEGDETMKGMIRDKHWEDIETNFPGMRRFYDNLNQPPETFLELWYAFLNANTLSHKQTISDFKKKTSLRKPKIKIDVEEELRYTMI